MASGADVKWVTAENFHITIKFLGNVEEDRLEAISKAMRSVAEETAPFDTHLSGTGAFPRIARPNVIWIGISAGADRFNKLAGRLDEALQELGFPREERGFSPHMTLGRSRSPRGAEQLRRSIEQMREEDAGSFRVESIALMKSEFRQNGPIYTPITDMRLREPDRDTE